MPVLQLPKIPQGLLAESEFFQLYSSCPPERLPTLSAQHLVVSSSPAAFFCAASKWNRDHLQALRIVPLVDLPLDLIVPIGSIPKPDNPGTSKKYGSHVTH
jgi:hypothetical protein